MATTASDPSIPVAAAAASARDTTTRFKCPVCVYTVDRRLPRAGTGCADCKVPHRYGGNSALCFKCADASGKCYGCGDSPKPPRTYLEAGRKYFENDLLQCEAKLLPLSTTLGALLVNEDRADFRKGGVEALSAAWATFASQRSGYRWKNKTRVRLESFLELFDVDGDPSLTPQLSERLQKLERTTVE